MQTRRRARGESVNHSCRHSSDGPHPPQFSHDPAVEVAFSGVGPASSIWHGGHGERNSTGLYLGNNNSARQLSSGFTEPLTRFPSILVLEIDPGLAGLYTTLRRSAKLFRSTGNALAQMRRHAKPPANFSNVWRFSFCPRERNCDCTLKRTCARN